MSDMHTEVLILGGGPGGYTAAFRAADLGKKVTLIERYPVIGGVCLNVGCIPSKALLHLAHIIHEAEESENHGISFGKSFLQGPHQDAQKSSSTTFPFVAESGISIPSGFFNVKSGAISPIVGGSFGNDFFIFSA